MNLSKLFVSAALALSIAGVLNMTQAQVGAEADKKICAVTAYQLNEGQKMGDRQFTRTGNTVNIGVRVTGNDCTRNVTLAGWEAQSLSGKPYKEQYLYAHKTEKFTPGDYKMSLRLPSDPACFYQIDLVRGTDPRGKHDGGAYEEGRMIHSVHGGTKDCYTKPVKKIHVCELATKKIIKIKASDFDPTLHTRNLAKCAPTTPGDILVCELTSKTVITIKENEFDASKHSKDLSVCDDEETPEVLAATGPASVISAIAGVTSLAGSASYYWTSRRR